MKKPPLILTLKPDDESFRFFDGLRQKHFPVERNFLSAHLTLFHHLPGEELMQIEDNLRKISANNSEFSLKFPEWRFLGKGVAVKVESPELLKLRTKFAELWKGWLTPQDQQKFQPHITIQNKVSPDQAKELFREISSNWEQKNGTAKGISLWHYLGGNWKLEEDFLFKE